MGAEKGYHRVVDFRYCQLMFFIFCKGGLKFGKFSKIRKKVWSTRPRFIISKNQGRPLKFCMGVEKGYHRVVDFRYL